MSFNVSFKSQKAGAVCLDEAREVVKKADAFGEQTAGQVIVGSTHQKQIDVAEKALATVAEMFPEQSLCGNVYGHANADGSGSVGFAYSFETPSAG